MSGPCVYGILFAAAKAPKGDAEAITAAASLSADLAAATTAVFRRIVVSPSDLNHRAPPNPTIIAVLSSDRCSVTPDEECIASTNDAVCVASHAPQAAANPTNTTPTYPGRQSPSSNFGRCRPESPINTFTNPPSAPHTPTAPRSTIRSRIAHLGFITPNSAPLRQIIRVKRSLLPPQRRNVSRPTHQRL